LRLKTLSGATRPFDKNAGAGTMDHNSNSSSRMIYWIIALGIGIRVFAAIFTYVTNPDGMVYIQQAKAIYFGDWPLLKSCVPFVSSYPFLIAVAYSVFHSWISSARLVSVFFGSLTLVPLYFLIKRFTDRRTAYFVVLLYDFMPALVGRSGELIRDPTCWFFLVSGLYLFVRQLEKGETFQRRFFYLISSYALFLLACWARPETFIVLIFSCSYALLYSLFSRQKKYLFVAVSSLLFLGLFLTAGLLVFNPSFNSYSAAASGKLSASYEAYRNLRQHLSSLGGDLNRGALRSYLFKVRDFTWLVDLGILVRNTISGVFYFYFPFFVLGFLGLTTRLRKDARVVYLFMLVILGYSLLFVHVLQYWYFEDRFLYIVIFSGCILFAFGVEKTIHFIRSRTNWRVPLVLILIALYIMAFGLGKNIKKRGEDRVVFRQIAEYILRLERPGHAFVPVLTANSSALKLVTFYLNLDLPKGYCPLEVAPQIENNEELIQYTQRNKVKYFVWDEKSWSKTQIDVSAKGFVENFETLGSWHQKEFGRIVLFCRN
jgi:4-amino-4-deoxy-L-arabinose transferase-like glycosyltransferase